MALGGLRIIILKGDSETQVGQAGWPLIGLYRPPYHWYYKCSHAQLFSCTENSTDACCATELSR